MKKSNRLTVTQTIAWEGGKSRRPFLLDLIRKNNVKTMIEVGVDIGKVTYYLLDNDPDLILYAIDIDIKKFYSNQIKEKYGSRLIPIQGISYNVADQIPNNSVDMVFIDADHSYEAVKKDIKAYMPKLKLNGLLTGHDIDYPGVNRAVNELIKDYDIGPNFVWIKKEEENANINIRK
jgi:predicted O-methyltransferase YrrM